MWSPTSFWSSKACRNVQCRHDGAIVNDVTFPLALANRAEIDGSKCVCERCRGEVLLKEMFALIACRDRTICHEELPGNYVNGQTIQKAIISVRLSYPNQAPSDFICLSP